MENRAEVGMILFKKTEPRIRWRVTAVKDGSISEAVYIGGYIGRFKIGDAIINHQNSSLEEIMNSGWEVDKTEMFNNLIDQYYGND